MTFYSVFYNTYFQYEIFSMFINSMNQIMWHYDAIYRYQDSCICFNYLKRNNLGNNRKISVSPKHIFTNIDLKKTCLF